MSESYDALLLVSFGGPEGPDDVMPFLENVLRGKNVPRERMLEVAEHYQHFGGVSPINEQNRRLIAALEAELRRRRIDLPIYWGNRNWHPMLTDTIRRMRDDGARRALALVTSTFSSYSGCRQYREDIERAREAVGPDAPRVDKLRVWFNHPGFIEAMTDRVRSALAELPEAARAGAHVLFTAHSIPLAMSQGAAYVAQLEEACRLVAERLDGQPWRLVYQSRSGPPSQPWLEPDILDALRALHTADPAAAACVAPIGFLSDHMEVLYDLDTEARHLCERLGMPMVRAGTVGAHPAMVAAFGELILERIADAPRQALGTMGPSHDVCPADCCPSGRPAARPDS